MNTMQDKYNDLLRQLSTQLTNYNRRNAIKFEWLERPTDTKTFLNLANNRLSIILDQKYHLLKLKYADPRHHEQPKEVYEFELLNEDMDMPQYWINYNPIGGPKLMMTNQQMVKNIIGLMVEKMKAVTT